MENAVEVKLDGNTILSGTDRELATEVDATKLFDIRVKYSDNGTVSEINIITK